MRRSMIVMGVGMMMGFKRKEEGWEKACGVCVGSVCGGVVVGREEGREGKKAKCVKTN